MEEIRKIVIIGPESTGKSTLCSKLADHYHTSWVEEYAREYLLKYGTNYTYENLLTIAKDQIDLEEKAITSLSGKLREHMDIESLTQNDRLIQKRAAGKYLFIDTDMNVMKVWCEFVFNNCYTWVLNRIAKRKYDSYLLCDVDLEWVPDSLREYPDQHIRQKLFHYYKDILENQSVPWTIINGDYAERFHKAVDFIDHLQTPAASQL
ncbi:MAG: ATP-binding protein [Ginsengibacter sp.]